ncbi:MAG: Protein of unknown function (DUF992) [Candidatus Kentron sp. G]|nr:MAG: Protein of unknown function (DUF992) [Candidatus Kentron sp. G]VFN04785.1 MAG: Protein of unknown function (DUF992) [Candidatus Kentron sp. G]VFN05807.1 MAG: Protein of unknown function (DUF992) [Candidatus Kentron sp. G]
MKKRLFSAVAAAFVFGLVSTQAAHAEDAKDADDASGGVKAGVLTCKKGDGGYNIIIHSNVPVTCLFKATNGEEHYKGEAGIGLGVDLEWDSSKTVHFTVLTAQSDTTIGAYSLAGKYAGASASATVGIGVGAQILIGGGDDNFTLEPIAVSGSTGFGLAGGLGYLHLEADRDKDK